MSFAHTFFFNSLSLAQASRSRPLPLRIGTPSPPHEMAPKAMKTAKAMTKGALAEALATESELKKTVCVKLIGSLAEIATKEVVKSGIFTLPGLCRIKTRMKPATKAGKREVFGKVA